MKDYEYLLSKLNTIKGIGKKTSELLIKKNINNIFDLLWHLPISKIASSVETDIKNIQIGKLQTIKTIPYKYNFPRMRNLPNKVICDSKSNKIDCVFFNTNEGYIRKILPLNKEVSINGKISFYKNKYQIINPKLIENNKNNIINNQNKYSLTEGLSLNKYNKIINPCS